MPSDSPDKDRVVQALKEFRGADSQRDLVVICDDRMNIGRVIRTSLEEAFSAAGFNEIF